MITLQNIIRELERTEKSRTENYRKLVQQGAMSPYTRDARLAVITTLLERCRKALKEKTLLKEHLKQLP